MLRNANMLEAINFWNEKQEVPANHPPGKWFMLLPKKDVLGEFNFFFGKLNSLREKALEEGFNPGSAFMELTSSTKKGPKKVPSTVY